MKEWVPRGRHSWEAVTISILGSEVPKLYYNGKCLRSSHYGMVLIVKHDYPFWSNPLLISDVSLWAAPIVLFGFWELFASYHSNTRSQLSVPACGPFSRVAENSGSAIQRMLSSAPLSKPPWPLRQPTYYFPFLFNARSYFWVIPPTEVDLNWKSCPKK